LYSTKNQKRHSALLTASFRFMTDNNCGLSSEKPGSAWSPAEFSDGNTVTFC